MGYFKWLGFSRKKTIHTLGRRMEGNEKKNPGKEIDIFILLFIIK
jgi:hypothetical protein